MITNIYQRRMLNIICFFAFLVPGSAWASDDNYKEYHKKYHDLQIFNGTVKSVFDNYIRVEIKDTLCREKQMAFKVDPAPRIRPVSAKVGNEVDFILNTDDCWNTKSYITIIGKR